LVGPRRGNVREAATACSSKSVKSNQEDTMAASSSVDDVDVEAWEAGLEALLEQTRDCFSTEVAWNQARAYVRGLLSGIERKNGWTLAEQAGDLAPQKMQRLLNQYSWDAGKMRDLVRSYVIKNLWDPDGVLVVDETGFLKKGTKSAGVQRQYSGTAGRVENCQLGVFLSYVTGTARAPIDCRLYLPESWIDDPERCEEAGIPKGTEFATKPELALDMIKDFVAAHPGLQWVAGDEVYGASRALREWLEGRQIGYVLAVACKEQVATAQGKFRVDELAAMVADDAWETYSVADGSKGPRLYDWAWIETTDVGGPNRRRRQVLIRRSRDDKKELAFFITHSPQPVPLTVIITVAGRRWGVEETFQAGKNEVGLDHYQVRLHHGWYRHVTLAMLAQAWLAVLAARSREKETSSPDARRRTTAVGYQRESDGIPIMEVPKLDRNTIIPLTLNEIRRVFVLLRRVACPPMIVLRWSNWRRRHQAVARHYHYLRRIAEAQSSAARTATT
jgi:SRSO17 transposase